MVWDGKYITPGWGILLAILLLIVLSHLVNDWNILSIFLFTIAILLGIVVEYYAHRKRKTAVIEGKTKPMRPPLIKYAFISYIIAVIFIVIGVNSIVKIPIHEPPKNPWTLWQLSGVLWIVNIFALLSILLTILSMYRGFRATEKGYALFPSIALIALSILIIWLNMTFLVPIIIGLNEALIHSWFGILN